MSESNNSRRLNRSGKLAERKLTIGILSVLIVIVSVITGFLIYNYRDIKQWDNRIYPGITIQNLDLSGKTKAQAESILEKAVVEKMNDNKINISAGDRNYTIGYRDINAKFDVKDTVNKALSYGKNVNILEKYRLIKKPKMINYKLGFSYDKKYIKNLTNKIASEVDRDPVNASISMTGVGFNITPEKSGVNMDKKQLENQLYSKITGDSVGDLNVKASMKVVSASIKTDDLKKINTLVSNFSTSYGSISSSQRANNISIATQAIDGTVVMPGNEFSFNDVVGERTAQKGYQAAPVIIGDKLEAGLGGGICQVSTTLYNAVERAKLTSTARTHHTMPVHYVAEGMDATVDYGNIDYKFRNDFKYPVYVQGYTSGGNVVFNLYSNSAAGK